jgi:peroxiredoxin
MSTLDELTASAEREWLDTWTAGPTEHEGSGLPSGSIAPDVSLPDHTGRERLLSEFWSGRPALLMFWRHFGCSCGVERARRLREEYDAYRAVGLELVIVGQGEPARAAAYRDEHHLPCPILCDPDQVAYRAYGVGQWRVERILYDAPAEYWAHPRELGRSLQDARRTQGRPPVDDPWRAAAELVIGSDGVVQVCHSYQHCEDFPDPRVLTTAARLA